MNSPLAKYKYGKQYKRLIIACLLMYVAEMCIKLPYTAQMVEIIAHFNTSRSNVALGLTIYYFSYGIGQLIISKFMDRINIRKFMVVTTVLTAISYACIAITTDLWQIWVLLGLNGFLQAEYWGGINYFIGKLVPNDCISYANKLMGIGFAISNTLVYAISGVFVALISWKATFIFSAIMLLLAIAYLYRQEKKTEDCIARGDEIEVPALDNTNTQKAFVVPAGKKINVGFIFGFCLAAGFLTNAINYGINNWIPNMLSEIHHFPNSLSIILTLVFPLVGVPCAFIMYGYFDKKGNIFLSGIVTGGIVFLIVAAFIFGYESNVLVVMLLCVLFRFFHGCYNVVYGNNTLMKLKNYINPAKTSLILNALISFSAGTMPFVTGKLLDNLGWTNFYIAMTVVAGFCFLFSILGYIVVKKNKELSKWF